MLLNFYLPGLENLGYDTILIGNEGGAEGSDSSLAVHLLLTIDTEGRDEGLVGVGDEGERQVVFGYELLMALGTLDAHTDDSITQRKEPFVVVTEVAGLIGAAGSGVLGIDVKHKLAAFEITEFNLFAVLVLTEDLRQSLSYFHCSICF